MNKHTKRSLDPGDKVRIGITHGDVNGISYEVILKTFQDQRTLDDQFVILYGISKVASYHQKTIQGQATFINVIKAPDDASVKKLNLINIYAGEVKIELGKPSSKAGEVAYYALESVVRDMKNDLIDAVVTAPINKKTIHSEKFSFPGHTEYFAQQFEVEDYLMLMVSKNLRIGVVTGHVPLSEVPGKLSTELIMSKVRVMNESLKKDFAIRKPKIAVLGLNPHAGDNGLLGKEEQEVIIPALNKLKEENILVFGPYPADGFFATDQVSKFDGILAMYHDQGLIPFKTLAFDRGVNFTAGLPIVRTSPAHGTAYELAGKDQASPASFSEALYLAEEIYRNRREYEELTSDPVHDYLNEIESGNNHSQKNNKNNNGLKESAQNA